jgi:hypothetical protein
VSASRPPPRFDSSGPSRHSPPPDQPCPSAPGRRRLHRLHRVSASCRHFSLRFTVVLTSLPSSCAPVVGRLTALLRPLHKSLSRRITANHTAIHPGRHRAGEHRCLSVRVEHHRSVLKFLRDTRCPLARPPMPAAAPPALSGAPLLPEIPQSSSPPHCVALAAFHDPPRSRPMPESCRPPLPCSGRRSLPCLHVGRCMRPSWARPWAARMLRKPRLRLSQARLGHVCAAQAGCAGTMQLGHGGFGPLALELFFYFLNIFKSLQIQNFVYLMPLKPDRSSVCTVCPESFQHLILTSKFRNYQTVHWNMPYE